MAAAPVGGYFFPGALWQQDGSPEMDKARSRCALVAHIVEGIAIAGMLAGIALVIYPVALSIIMGPAATFFALLSRLKFPVLGGLLLIPSLHLFEAARNFKKLTHDPALLKSLCDPATRTCTKERAITLLIAHIDAPLIQTFFGKYIRAYLNRVLH